jgi:hypothetical protein
MWSFNYFSGSRGVFACDLRISSTFSDSFPDKKLLWFSIQKKKKPLQEFKFALCVNFR